MNSCVSESLDGYSLISYRLYQLSKETYTYNSGHLGREHTKTALPSFHLSSRKLLNGFALQVDNTHSKLLKVHTAWSKVSWYSYGELVGL